MIFGVLNAEKIWQQQLVHLPTSPVYCSHFTLGNPKKSFFNNIIHSYFRLVTLSQKNKLLYPLHLKNVVPLPCKNCRFFIFFICSRVSSTNSLYGRVVERQRLVATWLHFIRAWWMIQLISGKKDWKHVPMQKVVTLNICCNVACLTFHLPHTTTGSFQCHQCRPTTDPQPAHFRSTNVRRNAHTFSQMKMLCILQGSGVTFFRCGG